MLHHWHWLSVLSVLSAVPLADLATPPATLWGDIREMHTWNSVPANWECLGPPPDGTTIDLYIALQPHRENILIEALHEVSNPEHQKYGAHLSREQVAELVAPHQDALELVHSWLQHHGVPSSSVSTSHGGGWLTITGVPVSQADALLCASYQLYKHTGMNETETILRTVSYALPVSLHGHVQTVAPTTHFASPHMPLQTPGKRSSEEVAVMANTTSRELVRMLSKRDNDDGPEVTPEYLRYLYKTDAYVPLAIGPGQNALGILGFKKDYPSQEDLTQFMADYREDAKAAVVHVVPVNGGGYDSKNPGAEASVDVQYTAAMSYPTLQVFYSTGGPISWSPGIGLPAQGDGYLGWFKYILDLPYIPPTISISYGNPEPSLPLAYAVALCNLFVQLGLRGVRVLVGSGDDGIGPKDCENSSGNVQFIPTFPASCPWVTSVGAATGFDPEIALDISGGGFSRYFPRPNYQDGAVFAFLEYLGFHHVGLYNPGGRGFPDIAAQAQLFMMVLGAEYYKASGTSCSTPTVAGIVSLLNDYRISTGRPPLGFLNLWLYGRAFAGLNDIKSGSNPGCGTDGFFATPGWDPVTGLGTPDFQKLQRILDT